MRSFTAASRLVWTVNFFETVTTDRVYRETDQRGSDCRRDDGLMYLPGLRL